MPTGALLIVNLPAGCSYVSSWTPLDRHSNVC